MFYTFAESCILSKFYIKPQLFMLRAVLSFVVSYRNSTSNHNRRASVYFRRRVVSYRNSTSNHNNVIYQTTGAGLYLIEILHQTTTWAWLNSRSSMLYLIEILHQTTTQQKYNLENMRCILSKFYIKPQRFCWLCFWWDGCILSKFYIKPQRPWISY